MSEFSMENIGRPEMPKKSIVLTVTLELAQAGDAVEALQAVESSVEGKAEVIGFNLFDSYRSLF
jgi:hypothetical protein